MSENKKLEKKLDPKVIQRRLEFILDEARSENPTRDMAITYAMRVISAYVSVGRDFGARGIKKKSKRMSRRAQELRKRVPEAEWLKNVVNEHQEPLKQVWEWIVKEAESLSPEKVLDRFKQWPMVTVTKDEDILLRKFANLDPATRYNKVGIEVLTADAKAD